MTVAVSPVCARFGCVDTVGRLERAEAVLRHDRLLRGAQRSVCTAPHLAGAVQTPITVIVIVIEITNNQTVLVPITTTVLFAFFILWQISPRSVYTALADKFLVAIVPAGEAKPAPGPRSACYRPTREYMRAPAVRADGRWKWRLSDQMRWW